MLNSSSLETVSQEAEYSCILFALLGFELESSLRDMVALRPRVGVSDRSYRVTAECRVGAAIQRIGVSFEDSLRESQSQKIAHRAARDMTEMTLWKAKLNTDWSIWIAGQSSKTNLVRFPFALQSELAATRIEA